MSWTINNLPLPDLDVEGVAITYQNQDDDFAEIRLPHDYDAAVPTALREGKEVVIRKGSRIYFRGTCELPEFDVSGVSEHQKILVFGPWKLLANSGLASTNSYYNYGDQSPPAPRAIIAGNAATILRNLLAVFSDKISVGTIDIGTINIPSAELQNQTYSQAISYVLRHIPSAVVIWDYTPAKPTIHILSDTSAATTEIKLPLDSGDVVSANLTPRRDLQLNSVALLNESKYIRRFGQCQLWDNDYFPSINTTNSPPTTGEHIYLISRETAANSGPGNSFRRLIRHDDIVTTTYSLRLNLYGYPAWQIHDGSTGGVVTGPGVPVQIWGSFFRVFGGSPNFYVNTSWFKFHSDPKGSVSFDNSIPAGYRAVYRLGKIHGCFLSGGIEGLPASPAIRMSEIPAPMFEAGLRAASTTVRWTGLVRPEPWGPVNYQAPDVCFVDPGQFSGEYFQASVSTPIPAVTTGMAAAILAANSRLYHAGRIVLQGEGVIRDYSPLQRRLNIPAISVVSPIQRVNIDSATDIMDIHVGPPNQLGPQDMISLLAASNA